MDDLHTLYQSIIRRHQKEERWRGILAMADFSAEGENPKCGDQIKIYAVVRNEIFVTLRFEAAGCALLNASASLMCAEMEGRPVAELQTKTEAIRQLLKKDWPDHQLSALGELSALAGAAPYPSRHRCILLPWETLQRI